MSPSIANYRLGLGLGKRLVFMSELTCQEATPETDSESRSVITMHTELDQLLLKCISITKYKLHFQKSNSNTFFNYFGYDGQNTKYKIHFLKVIKIQNTRYQ